MTLRRPGPLWLGGLGAIAFIVVDVSQRAGWVSLRRPIEGPAVACIQAVALVMLAAAIHWANQALAQARARAAQQEEHAQALQQSLLRGQRMEAVGRLAGGIAHDFNNLLTVIMSNVGQLQESSDQTPDSVDSREAIAKAASGGARLTRQLLAFGGRQVVTPEVVDVGALVQDFRPVLEHMAGRDPHLLLDVPLGLGSVRVDPGRLQQAVSNLVVNAAKACLPGSAIRITLEATTLTEDRHLGHSTASTGDYVILRVEDEGSGMDPAVVATAFEPFFTTRRHKGGYGLGLAVVHGIVTQSGGHVELRSVVDQGTTVSLWLRRVDAPTTWRPRPEPGAATGSLSGVAILLVDDAADARTAVRKQLERAGATVVEANGAQQALRQAETTPNISLAVVDVLMPGMSGPELVTCLRERGFTAPVTFLTGYAEPEGLAGLGASGTAILYKPVTTAELVRAVRAQLGQHPSVN